MLWLARKVRPPAELGVRLLEADESELAVVARPDSVDVYHGRREIIMFSVSEGAALRIGWFLIWRWWVIGRWCGLRPAVWRWALRRRLEAGLG